MYDKTFKGLTDREANSKYTNLQTIIREKVEYLSSNIADQIRKATGVHVMVSYGFIEASFAPSKYITIGLTSEGNVLSVNTYKRLELEGIYLDNVSQIFANLDKFSEIYKESLDQLKYQATCKKALKLAFTNYVNL